MLADRLNDGYSPGVVRMMLWEVTNRVYHTGKPVDDDTGMFLKGTLDCGMAQCHRQGRAHSSPAPAGGREAYLLESHRKQVFEVMAGVHPEADQRFGALYAIE